MFSGFVFFFGGGGGGPLSPSALSALIDFVVAAVALVVVALAVIALVVVAVVVSVAVVVATGVGCNRAARPEARGPTAPMLCGRASWPVATAAAAEASDDDVDGVIAD